MKKKILPAFAFLLIGAASPVHDAKGFPITANINNPVETEIIGLWEPGGRPALIERLKRAHWGGQAHLLTITVDLIESGVSYTVHYDTLQSVPYNDVECPGDPPPQYKKCYLLKYGKPRI